MWCMVPEIWSVWRTEFFVILDCFLPFSFHDNPKNQNFEKMKKTPRGIIILHMCTINDNHMRYGSWDIERNRHNFLSFWTIFCPFASLTTQKIKILEKRKKTPGDIIILHKFTINDNHMMYSSWYMKRDGQNFLSFGTVFPPFYPHNNPKNQNYEKLKKTHGDIIILQVYQNHDHMLHSSLDMACN